MRNKNEWGASAIKIPWFSFKDIYGKIYLLLNDGEQLQSVIANLLLHK